MFHWPIGNVPRGTWGSGWPDDPCGRAGRWFQRPVRPAASGGMPYKGWDWRGLSWCHTRVQELEFGGPLSNWVVSNVKTREMTPYRTYSASTWVPGQLPPPLDSARNEIGQLSSGIWAWCWTAPATKSDSLSSRLGSGRAGWLAGAGRCFPESPGRRRGRLRRRDRAWRG